MLIEKISNDTFSVRRHGKCCNGYDNAILYFHWNEHNKNLGDQSLSIDLQQS